MSVLSPELYNSWIHARVPISVLLGIHAVSFDDGQAVLLMPFNAQLARPVDVVSGPAIMALADFALGAAVLMDAGLEKTAFTADLNTRFLRKAVGCDVRAVARVLRAGKTLSSSEVQMFNAATGEMVAHATASFSVQDRVQETLKSRGEV